MGLVRTIAKRSLLRRPGRTLFSIAGVAIGIVTVVGVFTLDHNTVVGMSMRGADHWSPALEVRPGRGVASPQEDLGATPGVAAVTPAFMNQVAVRALDGAAPESGAQPAQAAGAGPDGERRGGGRRGKRGGRRAAAPAPQQPGGAARPRNVRLFAIDDDKLDAFEPVSVLAGRSLDPSAEAPEVLVGAPLALALGVDVGSRVALSRPRRAPRKDCVDGELRVRDEEVPLKVPGRARVHRRRHPGRGAPRRPLERPDGAGRLRPRARGLPGAPHGLALLGAPERGRRHRAPALEPGADLLVRPEPLGDRRRRRRRARVPQRRAHGGPVGADPRAVRDLPHALDVARRARPRGRHAARAGHDARADRAHLPGRGGPGVGHRGRAGARRRDRAGARLVEARHHDARHGALVSRRSRSRGARPAS